LLGGVLAGVAGCRGPERLALVRTPWPTLLNELADIDGLVLADDDVFAARAECISRPDGDEVVARIADHLEAAHHARPHEVPVVQLVLRDDVVVEPVEIILCQELPREEAGTAYAFQSPARGADTRCARRDGASGSRYSAPK
jgi:hypothetical protein